MKLQSIKPFAAPIVDQYGYSVECVNEDAKKLTKLLVDLQRRAKKGIDDGHTKGEIPVQWQHDANFVGMANFVMSTILVQDDVGVVIVSFSGFASCIVDLRHIAKQARKNGWATLKDVERYGSTTAQARAKSVRLFLEAFQGNCNAEVANSATVTAYELEDRGEQHAYADGTLVGGYQITNITPIKASDIITAIKNMKISETPFADLLKACEDMAGAVRQAGENTIDTRKKPVLIVIAGIPGLAILKRDVKYMSRQDLEFKICWDRNGVRNNLGIVAKAGDVRVLLNGRDVVRTAYNGDEEVLWPDSFGDPVTAYFDAKELGGAGNCSSYKKLIEESEEGNSKMLLYMCDVAHMARMQLLKQAVAFFKERIANRYNCENIQKLWDIPGESARIRNVVKAWSNIGNVNLGLVEAIRDLGQKYLSCMNASKKEIDDIEAGNRLYNVDKITTASQVKKAKEDRSTILEGFANEARIIFDVAQKITGKKLSAADRLRLIWHVVIKNATDKGVVAWDRLGNLAQNLLGPEYALWTLDTFSEENVGPEIADLVPKIARFPVHPAGVFADATAEELKEFDGLKVNFINGEAIDEGEVFLVGKRVAEFSGDFEIQAENTDAGVKLWAIKAIKDLVVVPKAQADKRVIKLASTCGFDEMGQICKSLMDSQEVYICRGENLSKGIKIGIRDDNGNIQWVDNARASLPNSMASLQAFNVDYNNYGCYGVKGTVTFYKTFQYDVDNNGETQTKASGFLVLENVTPVTVKDLLGK